jgi:hypothetical protein
VFVSDRTQFFNVVPILELAHQERNKRGKRRHCGRKQMNSYSAYFLMLSFLARGNFSAKPSS